MGNSPSTPSHVSCERPIHAGWRRISASPWTTQSAVKDRKGDAAHCHWLTALYVDADFKLLGEVETRRRLAEFPMPPSIVVNSGGGLHPYWLLRTPLDLQRDYPGAQSILRRLAKSRFSQ